MRLFRHLMTDIISIRAAEQRSISNADQVELRAISAGIAVPDVGVADENIAGELADLQVADLEMEAWNQQDVQIEDEVGAARDELLRRADILGEAYPFELNGGTLTYRPSVSGFYEYCVGIANTPRSIQTNPFTQLPRSFERSVGTILRYHLGPNWEGMHTGWPREEGEPSRFDELIRQISDRTCEGREWRWDPKPGYPADGGATKDGGVDFVVWRRSADRRIGQMFVLGQCACGNDWDTKFNDLMIERLEPWMRPFLFVPPTRCFTTPFILSEGNFQIAHENAGWVLDRIRLTLMIHELAGNPEIDAMSAIFNEMFELAAAA